MEDSIAIIGGGAAGVAALISAITRRAARIIYIIDPRPVGRGVVFSNSDVDLICNTSAKANSIVPGNPMDLLDYLDTINYPATSDSFVPRSVVGDYLVDRFRHYRDLAQRCGIEVVHLPYRFQSLKIDRHRQYELRLSDAMTSQSIVVTNVIFCTGFGATRVPDILVQYRGHPTFIECPYPESEMLAKVPASSRVLVIGTKLSAIDAAILLGREGHRVTMVSPSGTIPAVRTRVFQDENVVFDLERLEAIMTRWDPRTIDPDSASLHGYLKYVARLLASHTQKPWRTQFSSALRYDERLQEEILIAERGDSQWQNLVISFCNAVNALHLKNDDHFGGKLPPRFQEKLFRYVVALPLPNARKLMRYISDGSLTIERGDLHDVEAPTSSGDSWRVDWGKGPQRFDAVVSATGFHFPYYVLKDSGELEIEIEGRRPKDAVDVTRELAIDHDRLLGRESIWFVGPPAHTRLLIPHVMSIVAASADQAVANMMSFCRYEKVFPLDLDQATNSNPT